MTRLRAGLGRKCVRALTFVSTLALVAGPAAAQVDEADRLARCANNRQAIASVEGQLQAGGYWS